MKCAREMLSQVFSNMIDSTCLAHVISLVGFKWIDIFQDIYSFVADVKSLFVHSPARKHRYQAYLTRLGNVFKLLPEPVL